MRFKITIFFLIFVTSCIKDINYQNINFPETNTKFTNSGFALIYDDTLYSDKVINKKMNDRDLIIFQKNLKKGTSVKILNPDNNKSLVAQVGKKSNYPNFNNAVISKRIATELELKVYEPFIVIEEIHHNSSFIAKKAKTFDEEKKVANKAPVEKIIVKDLNQSSTKVDGSKIKKFSYSIKIADFYFKESAESMKQRILSESSIKKVVILKLSKNQFRVILGPYLDLKSLQKEYNKLDKLKFENIEILRNV